MSKIQPTTKELLGVLPAGVLINFLLGILAILLTVVFNGPRINIPFWLALALFFLFLGFYFTVCLNCILALPVNKYGKELIKTGPYRFVRHPMYAAIIFLLNPALAFVLRSWLILIFTILAFFAWKILTKKEEAELVKIFGADYLNYQKETGGLFPNLLKINKHVFFVFWTIIFLILALIIFNFNSFKNNFIAWDVEYKVNVIEQVIKENISVKNAFKAFAKSSYELSQDNFYASIFSLPTARGSFAYNTKHNIAYDFRVPANETNKIKISKINVEAPLVYPASSKEKDINYALNRGVIIYPGSVVPPNFGNLFLTGHSSVYFWNKSPYGKIFANLDRLKPGDEILVSINGYTYKYRVIQSEIKKANDIGLVQYHHKHILTLMTCWPTGSSSRRLLVTAELVK